MSSTFDKARVKTFDQVMACAGLEVPTHLRPGAEFVFEELNGMARQVRLSLRADLEPAMAFLPPSVVPTEIT